MVSRRLLVLIAIAVASLSCVGYFIMGSLPTEGTVVEVERHGLLKGGVDDRYMYVDTMRKSALGETEVKKPQAVGDVTVVTEKKEAVSEAGRGTQLQVVSSGGSPRHAKYLDDPLTGELRGNKRCIVPLLLTDAKYHGTRLLATTLKGWIMKLLVPQKTMDLVIYYDAARDGLLDDIVGLLKLRAAEASLVSSSVGSDLAFDRSLRPEVAQVLSSHDRSLLEASNGFFVTPHHATLTIRIIPTVVPFPSYIQKEPELLNRSEWLRCGCPPYCPTKRATVGYVQGTRWYTFDLFLEPTMNIYSYWMKVDVDIWMFRELDVNIVERMMTSRSLVAHTGTIYNGNGCSNDLHRALMEYYNCPFDSIKHQKQNRRDTICTNSRIVSANQSWWKQDDSVYYTNFVVYSVPFFMDKEVMALSFFLNEYKDGFFRWRWTDQSLAHKFLGVFAGPDEDNFRLDWSYLRWRRGQHRPVAAFWHGKSSKSRKDLLKYTKL